MDNVSLLIPKRRFPQWLPSADVVDVEAAALVEIPLLGTVAAGNPIDVCGDNETVSVPAHMVRKETYALRVRGNSMIDENIQDGDVIVMERRQTAENGQAVVVLINGEQTTLKKFYVEQRGIRLEPANPELQPIFLSHDEVEILGIVTCVIRMPNAGS